jgi:2-polyprenyl-3-methyl-5-hydroxy-6-metoxy-1,4-benzoquinol methylase
MFKKNTVEKYRDMQREYFESEAENMARHDHSQHNANPYLWDIGFAPIKKFSHGNFKYTALDFGCGGERNMLNLSSFGTFERVDGCDIAKGNIEAAQKSIASKYPGLSSSVFRSSGLDCKSPFEIKYDFIFSSIVLQHIPVRTIRNAIISDLIDLLTPEGTLSFQMAVSGKVIKKMWGLPLRVGAVNYYEEKSDAESTNGGCDVGIENPQDLVTDLKFLGGTNIRWYLTPSWEDLHPLWLWVHVDKAR